MEETKSYDLDNRCQIKSLNQIYMKYFGYKESGWFVDVGACDGITWSNTSGLAFAGWHGLMIEPRVDMYKGCKENFLNYKNVIVENCAVGDYNGKAKFYTSDGKSLSTIKENLIDVFNSLSWARGANLNKNRFVIVDIFTLNTLLEKHNVPVNFDVLSIDVEGAEIDVLKEFDIDKYMPKLAIVEVQEKGDMLRDATKSYLFANEYFGKRNYEKIYSDETNNIYGRM